MFKRILVPYDFSACARSGLAFAPRLLDAGGAIRLIHVFDESIGAPAGNNVINVPRLRMAIEGQLERTIAGLRVPHRDARLVDDRRPSDAILAEAQRWHADAIVLGSHGRKGVARLFLGSLAERMIREASIPVCIVKEGIRTPARLRRIGCAVDLSRAGNAIVDFATRLAKASEATLHLIYVRQPIEMQIPAGMVGVAVGDGNTRELRETVDRSLKQLLVRTRKGWSDTTAALRTGGTSRQVAAYASDRQLDLLVMGTHARKGLDRLIMGSVAAEVTRRARCPLLVVSE